MASFEHFPVDWLEESLAHDGSFWTTGHAQSVLRPPLQELQEETRGNKGLEIVLYVVYRVASCVSRFITIHDCLNVMHDKVSFVIIQF